jgi:hypothetical protein
MVTGPWASGGHVPLRHRPAQQVHDDTSQDHSDGRGDRTHHTLAPRGMKGERAPLRSDPPGRVHTTLTWL